MTPYTMPDFACRDMMNRIDAESDHHLFTAGRIDDKTVAVRMLERDLGMLNSIPEAVADINARIALIRASASLDDARRAYAATVTKDDPKDDQGRDDPTTEAGSSA